MGNAQEYRGDIYIYMCVYIHMYIYVCICADYMYEADICKWDYGPLQAIPPRNP